MEGREEERGVKYLNFFSVEKKEREPNMSSKFSSNLGRNVIVDIGNKGEKSLQIL